MPTWSIIALFLVCSSFVALPISSAISFIYEDKSYLELFFSYVLSSLLLYVMFVFEDKLNKSAFPKTLEKKLLYLIIVPVITWLPGSALSNLTPMAADLLASEFVIREYKAVRVEPYAKTSRHLSKLYVVDIYNNETSFVLKDEMLNQLKLRAGDRLLARGRNCIAGFVIDNINGIERE